MLVGCIRNGVQSPQSDQFLVQHPFVLLATIFSIRLSHIPGHETQEIRGYFLLFHFPTNYLSSPASFFGAGFLAAVAFAAAGFLKITSLMLILKLMGIFFLVINDPNLILIV